MSKISNLQKQNRIKQEARQRWRFCRPAKKRERLPKTFYYALKKMVGTADFARQVELHGSVHTAILDSAWYRQVRLHPGFKHSKTATIWIQRMSKNWTSQQWKRLRSEKAPALPRKKKVKKPSPAPREVRKPLQALMRNNEVYVVCSHSLSRAIGHQKLLMAYDLSCGLAREDLAKQINGIQHLVRAKVFVGKVKQNVFAHQAERFDWQTHFDGVLLEIEYLAEGFKTAWKGRIVETGNCNIIRGWQKHFIHRRTNMPVRFQNLVLARLKEAGKSHLIRDLGFVRAA